MKSHRMPVGAACLVRDCGTLRRDIYSANILAMASVFLFTPIPPAGWLCLVSDGHPTIPYLFVALFCNSFVLFPVVG